ncbi:MAG: Asp-tRNA(Asn)/Glu-tRNA(Gln) amidotransferase subunit GatA [Ferruginibacter sp.]
MFSFHTIAGYQQQLLLQQTSCTEAVTHYLAAIEKNTHLNAFTEVYAAEALEKAALLDARRAAGQPLKKLHGVVIAIKDVICYKDHTVTAASKILQGFKSLYNATALERLLEEEAIIIGACNCDEFAMGSSNENSYYGNVRNALDTGKVPGGSSGGSAVAVQAGLCMSSLGSDTGGSVRQPADFCGIIGLKPTYGTISRYGLIAYASSFDQIGIFGTSIADIALLLAVMNGEDEYDSTAIPGKVNSYAPSPRPLRIAYFKQALEHPSLDKEIASAISSLLSKMKDAGEQVDAVDFTLLDYVVPAYYVLTTAEASSNLSRYDGIRYGYRTGSEINDLTDFYSRTRSEGFGKEVQRRIMLGTFVLSAGYYDAYYSKAQQVRRLLVQQVQQLFTDYDAVIMPVSPSTAFAFGEKNEDPTTMYLADIYTVFANLTGIPAIAIPLFRHSNGMPFGLQVMTAKSDELTLLQLADQLLQLSPVKAAPNHS